MPEYNASINEWVSDLSDCLEILFKQSLNPAHSQELRDHLSDRFDELKKQIDNILRSKFELQTQALQESAGKMKQVMKDLNRDINHIKGIGEFLDAVDQVVIQLSKFFGLIALAA